MPVSVPANPKITVKITGLMISHIVDRTARAEIGLLRNAPYHKMSIKITRRRDGAIIAPPMDYTKSFSLLVNRVIQPGIRVHTNSGFNRMTSTGTAYNQDFGWIIDLDREILGRSIAPHLDPTELQPMIYFNKGVFYTFEKSDNQARLIRGMSNDIIGKVADSMGIAIDVPADGEAVLTNGGTPLYTFSGSDMETYLIEIDRDCDERTYPDKCPSDFKLLFNAIKIGLSAEEKAIDLRDENLGADSGDGGSPEVPCLGGNYTP